MNNDVFFISSQIMKWFKQSNSSVGDIMTPNHLLSLSCRTPIWNMQQKRAIPDAIKYLIGQGYITENENNIIKLTEKGYNKIHRESYSEIIENLLEKYQSGDVSNTTIMHQTNYNIKGSSIVGSQVGTVNSQLNFNQSDLSDEISQAILKIKEIAELSEENKKIIIELLQQIDVAVKSDNKDVQTEAKFTLKGILKGIGNTSVKVISVLSGLVNLAKFFGFQTP